METNSTSQSRHASSAHVVALLFLLIFCALPIQAFFSLRGLTFATLFSGTSIEVARRLFPLFGLLAFTMVWYQVLLGSNGWWLYRRAPVLLRFHRTHGIIAFSFAVLHPVLLIAAVGLTAFLQKSFVPAELRIYATIGTIQLVLLTIAVLVALVRRMPWLRRHWKKFHILNYVVFILIWIHSWFLGTDVQTTWLRFLWVFFALAVFVSTVFRVTHLFRSKHQQPVLPSSITPPTIPHETP